MSKTTKTSLWLALSLASCALCCMYSTFAMDYNWEQPFRKTITLEGHKAEILIIQTSPDESFVLTADLEGVTKIWDTNLGVCIHTLEHEQKSPINYVTISPDSSTIAIAHQDFTIKIWNSSTRNLITTISLRDKQDFTTLHIATLNINDSYTQCLIVVRQDGIVDYYNAQTGMLLRSFTEGQNAYMVRINPITNTLLLSHQAIDLYDLTSHNLITTFEKPEKNKNTNIVTGNHKNRFASFSKYIIQAWDILPIKSLMNLDVTNMIDDDDKIYYILFNHDDTCLTIYSSKNTVILWDIEKNREISHFKKPHHTSEFLVELSPDKNYSIALSSTKNKATLQHAFTKSRIKKFKCYPKCYPYLGISIPRSAAFLGLLSGTSQGQINYFHKKLCISPTQSTIGHTKTKDITTFSDTYFNFN